MMNIRLIRPVLQPTERGPGNGMYALQRALLAEGVMWLKIGHAIELQDDEMPWIWSWEDKPFAVRCQAEGRPFILGPCVFFGDVTRPAQAHCERTLLDASNCRRMFTESSWYLEMIESYRGQRNRAKIQLWPFPIDPLPDGPLPAKHDLLIYAKSGTYEMHNGPEPPLLAELQNAYPSNVVIRYGSYCRQKLIDLARASRACVYLSNSDRGPLALAEILLCGCPAVGFDRGAPWLNGCNGNIVAKWEIEPLIEAISKAKKCDREAVREMALAQFSPSVVASQVLDYLDAVRLECQ